MGVNEISDGCRHRIVADDIEIVETAVAVAEGVFKMNIRSATPMRVVQNERKLRLLDGNET